MRKWRDYDGLMRTLMGCSLRPRLVDAWLRATLHGVANPLPCVAGTEITTATLALSQNRSYIQPAYILVHSRLQICQT
jgi:hypothetical protein